MKNTKKKAAIQKPAKLDQIAAVLSIVKMIIWIILHFSDIIH